MHKFNIAHLEKLDNPERRQSMPPEETLRKFGIGESGTLLDVGCGVGYFTIAAASILKDGTVIGIDIMNEIIGIAKERSQYIKNIKYKKSEEYSFPIEDKSIDYVFICNVIHEVEDKSKYFNEIKRVLKPGGALSIIEWETRKMEICLPIMGPPLNERVPIEEMKTIASSHDMLFVEEIHMNANQYGVKFKIV